MCAYVTMAHIGENKGNMINTTHTHRVGVVLTIIMTFVKFVTRYVYSTCVISASCEASRILGKVSKIVDVNKIR